MKRNVKGFTLIELIVVMATFSIIMFGAMSLMTPVSKMMVQSDTHEGGNAAVSSIATLMQNELSPAEYMVVSNEVLDNDTQREAAVNKFVLDFYEGVLREGSTVASPSYGSGKVHVMTIDNDENGKISTYSYDVQFNPVDDIHNYNFITHEDDPVPYAVNKAYYDDYRFEIRSGLYGDPNDFYKKKADGSGDLERDADGNPILADPDTYQDLLNNLTSKETVFTIKADTYRNKTLYSFVSKASMSLVNIYNRGGGGVSGEYYVIHESYNALESDPAKKKTAEIADITKSNLSRRDAKDASGVSYGFTLSRNEGQVAVGNYVDFKLPDPTKKGGYTFIYSYGNEIDIS